MARLPTPGGDDGAWGTILNDYLSVAHSADGNLNSGTVTTSQLVDGAVTNAKLDTSTQTKLNSAATAVQSVNGKTGTSVTLTAGDVGALQAKEQATAPSSPSANDLWYDSVNDLWKRWNGSAWAVEGSSTYIALPSSPSDQQLLQYNASLAQWVPTNPSGSSELAYAENNTGTKDGPFTGAFAWHDVTGCSIVVPASMRPVYLWAALTSGTTSGASASTPLFGFLQIVEVSNGVDTPITWQSGASINVNNTAFPIFFPMRRLGATARTRTFKLQFSNASTGSWSAWNGSSGTDSSRICAVAM